MSVGLFMLLGLAVTASYIGYQNIDRLYYEQIAGIVGKVVAQNPESEVLVVQSLKQLDAVDIARGKQLLQPYGYEGEFLELAHNQRGFESIVRVNLLMITLVFFIVVAIGYGIYRGLKYRFNALRVYLMQIAKGNYVLNIEGMGEDRFSILEDEIYKTTLALRESKEAQEKEKLLLAQNIADISHQLKTPLTSMGIMTELLMENEPSVQNKQFIGQLDLQIERLSKLVSVLLKLAKFDAGTVKLKKEEIVVSDLIEEVIEMLEVPIRQKKIKLHLEGADKINFTGDRNWTYEAIHNVLYNCVQHSPEEGNIMITWSDNPIYTEMVIEDQGGGIAVADLPHLFTRFYKGENACKEGIGIGLAMAKTIIEKQNGEIKAKNSNGGAQFQIKFY